MVSEASLELAGSLIDSDADQTPEGMMTVEDVEKTELRGQFENYKIYLAIFTGKFRKKLLRLLRWKSKVWI